MISTQASLKEQVLRLAQKLPTSPQIFSRLGLLLNDINADIGKIVNLISIDTGLSARVLRLSNSVFFRGSLRVQSLDEAVNRLGFREVHKIVGVAMTEQVFRQGLPSYGLTAAQLLDNSVATALAMETLADAAGADKNEAYTLGVLRPVGKLVLGGMLEKDRPGLVCPDDMDLVTWERAHLNIASHEATALILEAWKLPQEMHVGVLHHHVPEASPDNGRMAALLHLASWVAKELGHGMKCEAALWEVTFERLNLAGLSKKNLEDTVAATGKNFQALKQHLGLH